MIRRIEYLLEIIKRAKANVGKTLLQKVVFVLQEWMDVDLGYDYRLHYYGPYSAALSDDINSLDDLGLARVRSSCSGSGYDIELTSEGEKFLNSHALGPFDLGKIDSALAVYTKKNVTDLELVATILYFAKKTTDVHQLVDLVAVVKPHFTNDQVTAAYERLRRCGKLALS